jgi:signal transduction histidine kinase
LVDLVRRRNRTQLDVALLFGSLAFIVLSQELITFTGQRPLWLVKATQVALMAHPYLLLRLVEHFRPVPAGVRGITVLGMLATSVALVLVPGSPPALTIGLIVYFALVEIYSVSAFVQSAVKTAGVTHWRLRFIALGSGLLAAIFLLAGVNIALPALAPYIGLLLQFMALASALSYYIGFSPPGWLRRVWQLNELHRFLHQAAGKPALERSQLTLPHLCDTAVRLVGGRAAVAALWDDSQQLVIRHSTQPGLTGHLSSTTGITGQSWQSGRPALGIAPGKVAPESAELMARLSARALMAVPIATVDRAWGLLVVFLRRNPLFAADDLELLSLFAEQSAMTLEQTRLLNEQQSILAEQQKLVEQLRERTGQLEESNQELESFSYSVSHDLRAPLRHIEGFTDLLFKTGAVDTDDKSRRYLALIAEAATRMGRLIDNLLAFSRLGRAALVVTPVDLAGLVDEVRRELQLETQEREIVWKVAPLPRVSGDPMLLRLVLLNLLSNALKYTRLRTRTLIEIGCLDDRREGIVVYVRDNGVGFDMQYVDKLFGVFQRLHHADEFEGTGIGLANVRRIVHRHGGRTWADGALDQGATFYFTLPNVAAEPVASVPGSPGSPGLSVPPPGRAPDNASSSVPMN